MKKRFLGGLAALTLALASCGGPSTPAPGPSTGTTGPQQPAPAPGPIADVPEGSTAAREFVFTGRAVPIRPQSLQSLELQPLADIDLGQRLRVVLTVNRAKSGANIGKKKATVTFIWGNQAVNLAGTYTLGLGEFGTAGALKATDGKLNLAVKSPDFQAKAGRSTAYAPDDGPLCARLTFNLSAGAAAWSSNTPVEVCEGPAEREQEQQALEKFAGRVRYSYQSAGSSAWKFQRMSAQQVQAMPTSAEVLAALNLPTYTPVIQMPALNFFTELSYSADSYPEGMPSKERSELAKRNGDLYTQFPIYYKEARAYKIRVSAEREMVYVLGRNSYGLAGLTAFRFLPSGSGRPDPGYAAATTYSTFGSYGGSLKGEVQVGPHAPGAVVTGAYALRSSSTCSAGVGVALNQPLIYKLTFDPYPNGLTGTVFDIEASPDPLKSTVLDYEVTVSLNGSAKKYRGFACYTYTPPTPDPSPPPSSDAPATLSDAMIFPALGGGAAPDGSRFDAGDIIAALPSGATVRGTYVIRDMSECGSSGARTYFSGAFDVSQPEWVLPWEHYLEAQTSPQVGAGAGMVYDVTATSGGASRRWQSFTCWAEFAPPPPDTVN